MILVGFGDISKLRDNSFLSKSYYYTGIEELYSMQMYVISDGNTNMNYTEESEDMCFEMLEGDSITVKVDKDSN